MLIVQKRKRKKVSPRRHKGHKGRKRKVLKLCALCVFVVNSPLLLLLVFVFLEEGNDLKSFVKSGFRIITCNYV
jgi:hypothetical protein